MQNPLIAPEQSRRFLLFLKRHAKSNAISPDEGAKFQLYVVAAAWTVVGLLILLAVFFAVQIKGHS